MSAPVKVTSKKIESGLYRVIVNGVETVLVVDKGDPPKYRQPQLWSIGRMGPHDKWPYWVANDFPSKSHALDAVRILLEAASWRPQ
jgi:hypothetical protein